MELKNLPVSNLRDAHIVVIGKSGAGLADVTGIAPIGTIHIFAGAEPPAGWFFCDGKYLEIGSYPQLFNIIGYRYGGEAQQFRLPNLVGRFIALDMLISENGSFEIMKEVVMNYIIRL